MFGRFTLRAQFYISKCQVHLCSSLAQFGSLWVQVSSHLVGLNPISHQFWPFQNQNVFQLPTQSFGLHVIFQRWARSKCGPIRNTLGQSPVSLPGFKFHLSTFFTVSKAKCLANLHPELSYVSNCLRLICRHPWYNLEHSGLNSHLPRLTEIPFSTIFHGFQK